MNARAPLVAAALALSAATASACVSQPVVALDHAEIRGGSFAGVTLVVMLRVNNKNAFDVQVRNVRGQASLGNRWLLPPIDYSPNVWLPADVTAVGPTICGMNMAPGVVHVAPSSRMAWTRMRP